MTGRKTASANYPHPSPQPADSMTEIFTKGPHNCGDYDPRIMSSGPSLLSTDDLIFYCTLRNVYGIFASFIALLGIVGNVISLIILPKAGGARSALVFLQSLGVYDTVFLGEGGWR